MASVCAGRIKLYWSSNTMLDREDGPHEPVTVPGWDKKPEPFKLLLAMPNTEARCPVFLCRHCNCYYPAE